MKLTKSKLKQLIKEAMEESREREREQFVGDLAEETGRDYNILMRELERLFLFSPSPRSKD